MSRRNQLIACGCVLLGIACMGLGNSRANESPKNGNGEKNILFMNDSSVALLAGNQLFVGIATDMSGQFIELSCAEMVLPEAWDGTAPVCKNDPTVWHIRRDAITAMQLLGD